MFLFNLLFLSIVRNHSNLINNWEKNFQSLLTKSDFWKVYLVFLITQLSIIPIIQKTYKINLSQIEPILQLSWF
jgi:hypothetical protein